jgi:hypothetical protein
MGSTDLLLGVVGVDQIGLGREGIPRPGGQNDVVSGDLLSRRRQHPVRFDHRGPIPDDPAIGEQARVGEEDPGEPGGIHQRAKSCDVVHEGVLGLDEHDVARLVQRFGHGVAAVPAPDHHHGWLPWVPALDPSARPVSVSLLIHRANYRQNRSSATQRVLRTALFDL